jgi:hypothetical protein
MTSDQIKRQNKSIEKLFKKLNIKEDESITLKEIIEKNNTYIYPPKRPSSAYIFFSKKERKDIKNKNPEIRFGDIAKLIGTKWKQISEKDKKKFVKMAEDDKIRYNKQIEEYKKENNKK